MVLALLNGFNGIILQELPKNPEPKLALGIIQMQKQHHSGE
jgi:hypothetical protein